MDREITPHIRADMAKKIILLSGPRQSGKTTISKALTSSFDYFNYDDAGHRRDLREKNWDRSKTLVIFDELHKMPEWKTWLKAIYDVEGIPPSYMVTGRANMETFRKMGDSLAGRFFSFRLHPFDVREVRDSIEPEEALSRIMRFGGFPEPFLENDPVFYARWKRSHLDVILRQDLLDLVAISDIKSVEVLIELLRNRVCSPVSFSNLANDLQKDPKTIKVWLTLLENLYIIFPVRPWHRNIARSILKEPKYYFYDTGQVKGNDGQKLENAVACALKKSLDFLEDTRGLAGSLNYIRTKDGKELDFAVSLDDTLTHLFEVKLTDTDRAPAFGAFPELLKSTHAVQLVGAKTRRKTWPDGLSLENAAAWLADFDLRK